MKPFTRGQLASLRLIRQAEADAARAVAEREAAQTPAFVHDAECELNAGAFACRCPRTTLPTEDTTDGR